MCRLKCTVIVVSLSLNRRSPAHCANYSSSVTTDEVLYHAASAARRTDDQRHISVYSSVNRAIYPCRLNRLLLFITRRSF